MRTTSKGFWNKISSGVAVKDEWDDFAVSRPFDEIEESPAEAALDSLRRARQRARQAGRYLVVLLKQLFLATFIGIVAGVVGAAFQLAIRTSSEFFLANDAAGTGGGSFRVLFLLPFAGLAIVALYKACRLTVDAGTDQAIDSLTDEKKASLWLAPAIFASSTLTQLFGGSAGREGAALQLGGSVGLAAGKLFRLKRNEFHVAVLCGMSGGFAAVFGAPLTASIFALEIACVGVVYYPALLPSLVSATIGASFAAAFGFPPFSYTLAPFPGVSVALLVRALVLGVCCGLVCVFFCSAIRRVSSTFKRRFPNDYFRAAFGGLCVAAATVLLGTNAYNGTGFLNVQAALDGKSLPWDFLLKTLFTAVTLGAGFKGGEIVPSLAVGATFGSVAGSALGLDASQGAALGMIAVFCGATNCPLTALALSVELFGAQNALIFAIVCGISYMTSGQFGLYRSQKILFSKLTAEPFDVRLRETFQKDLKVLETRMTAKKNVK
ncbi:MAG: chloride channel protein [Thermoguttaceae bacterium]|nr:chloride channel protein [Thermoguttaceae bacterium]MBR5757273.1 chloride channel protein [Thermoguttaceae bacterium]